ncbi:DNA-directed RNA polymerase sigma-70 factor [Streptomyces coeruleorubidus]|nr:DNA-directed RNA polymerase sigma-70 factor [Streptomyces coeruleorubidus]
MVSGRNVPFAPTRRHEDHRNHLRSCYRNELRSCYRNHQLRNHDGENPVRESGAGSGAERRAVLGDDAELTAAVRAAQDGDETAFRTVYRTVHPRLLGYVRTLVGDPDAEDVTSEAWLQIARDLERFTGDADRFRGWAARIARNRALDHIRMRGRRPAIGGDETELTGRAAESDTADEAIEALATDGTFSLISRLPQDQAEAVVLRVVVGLDAKTAAETLGKRPGAVRTAAHRGLKRLAELLGEDPEADPESAGVLDALPPQREPRGGAMASARVTQSVARTQKDV